MSNDNESKVIPFHAVMVQVEDTGGIWWSGPYNDNVVEAVMNDYERYGYSIVDCDCSVDCLACKEGI